MSLIDAIGLVVRRYGQSRFAHHVDSYDQVMQDIQILLDVTAEGPEDSDEQAERERATRQLNLSVDRSRP